MQQKKKCINEKTNIPSSQTLFFFFNFVFHKLLPH